MDDAGRSLEAVWREVYPDWQDDVAARFVREFWTPLIEVVGRYQAALKEMDVVLDAAESIDDRKVRLRKT